MTDKGAEAEYLRSLANWQKQGWNLGLERITGLLAAMGDPHRRYPSILVAGTNGKGSTAAMIAAMLQGAGYTVGFYTSPHLVRYTERMVILEPVRDGNSPAAGLWGWPGAAEISAGDFAGELVEIERLAPGLQELVKMGPPTEFEVLTAAAFSYFARRGVDVVVAEVGLGGRLDATNTLEPEVSVITHVALDHQDRLGDTLAAIAGEKAGIIKEEGSVVVAPQEPEAEETIFRIAGERSAHARAVREGEDFRPVHTGLEGNVFDFLRQDRPVYLELACRLLGIHQIANAATAVAAIEELKRQGWSISHEAVRWGMANVHWPGRLEVVPGTPMVILDGAHNPDGMSRLVQAREEIFPHRRCAVVTGMLADKDYPAMAAMLAPRADRVVTTTPDSHRAIAAADLAKEFSLHGAAAEAVPEPGQALARARELAGPDGMVLVCGSLYLIGPVRAILGLR